MAFMAFLLSWGLSVAQCGVEFDVRRPRAQSRKLVKEEIDGGDRLILIVRVSGLDYAGDAVDRVATTVGPLVGVVEHGLFIVELVDGRATTRRVFFAEDITEIAKK